jgi:hypothetical protein
VEASVRQNKTNETSSLIGAHTRQSDSDREGGGAGELTWKPRARKAALSSRTSMEPFPSVSKRLNASRISSSSSSSSACRVCVWRRV